VPSGVEGIVIHTEKFSRRMSLSEDERKKFEKDLKTAETDGNAKIAEAFIAMAAEIETILKRPLTDAEGTPLVRDQEHKYVAEQARIFKIEAIDIRSPERRAEVEKAHKTLWPAVEAAIDDADRKLNSMKRGDELRSGVLQSRRQDFTPGRYAFLGRRNARPDFAESVGRA
jgi:DNA-directed RNA polymerase subunit beta